MQECSFGSRGPADKAPLCCFVITRWRASCWQRRPAGCPLKEGPESSAEWNCRCMTGGQQGPEGEARCGTSLLGQWETLCVHPAHVLSAFLWYKPGHGWRQRTTNLQSRKELLESFQMFFPQESWMTSFQLSSSSIFWTISDLRNTSNGCT